MLERLGLNVDYGEGLITPQIVRTILGEGEGDLRRYMDMNSGSYQYRDEYAKAKEELDEKRDAGGVFKDISKMYKTSKSNMDTLVS